MAAVVGAQIPFHRNYPAGLIPSALADTTDPLVLEGKDGLIVLGDRPLNAETPAHLLDDDVTPNNRHFVRDNGLRPEMAEKMDAAGWTFTVDGEVDKPLTLTLDDLKRDFKPVKLKLQLECGGNGRASFNPPAKGNQWTIGGVGNAEWTGVPTGTCSRRPGVRRSAVYTGHYGMDLHLSRDPSARRSRAACPSPRPWSRTRSSPRDERRNRSRSTTASRCGNRVPGWAASTSHKWLKRNLGARRGARRRKRCSAIYRVPRYPVAPGADVPMETTSSWSRCA